MTEILDEALEEAFELPEPEWPVFEQFCVGPLVVKLEYDEDPQTPREFCNLGVMVCWHRRYTLGDEQPSESPEEYLWNLAAQARPRLMELVEEKAARLKEALPYTYGMSIDSIFEQYAPIDQWQEKIRDAVIAKHYLMLPLYLYDHSGITMSTGAFGCPWDSGQVGFIYMSVEDALHNWSQKSLDDLVSYGPEQIVKTVRERALEALEGEVQTYDDYLTGQIAGYVVEDRKGNHVDSCWGYFPDHDEKGDGWTYLREEATHAARSSMESHFAVSRPGEH